LAWAGDKDTKPVTTSDWVVPAVTDRCDLQQCPCMSILHQNEHWMCSQVTPRASNSIDGEIQWFGHQNLAHSHERLNARFHDLQLKATVFPNFVMNWCWFRWCHFTYQYELERINSRLPTKWFVIHMYIRHGRIVSLPIWASCSSFVSCHALIN
jgi:hypothetical protein